MNFRKILFASLAIFYCVNTLAMEGLGKRQPDDHALITAKKQKPEPSQINWFEFLSNDIKLQILEYLLQSSPRLLAAFQQLGKIAQLDKSFYNLAYSQDIQKIFESGHLQNKVKAAPSINLCNLVLAKASNRIIEFVLGINGLYFQTFISEIGLIRTTVLHQIISKGLTNLLEKLVKNKDKNNILSLSHAPDSLGYRPMAYALKNKDQATLEILKKDIAVNAAVATFTPEANSNLLINAAAANNIEQIKFLLENGVHVDLSSKDGLTPLSAAIACGKLESTKLLLENGADLSRDSYNNLIRAIEDCNLGLVRLLIEKGININEKDADGETALSMASKYGFLEIAKELIKSGACLKNDADFHQIPLINASENGHLDLAELLIENGAQIDEIHPNGFTTALTSAIENNHLDLIKLLIDKGAKVEIKGVDFEGHARYFNNLLVALRKENPEIAKFLIENGATVNAADSISTPLMEASSRGYLDIVKILLAKGAKDMDMAYNGENALYCALANNHLEIAEILLKQNYSTLSPVQLIKILEDSVKKGHLDKLKLLEANGINYMKICSKFGFSILNLASKYGQSDIVEFLLKNGANIEEKSASPARMTPLMVAATAGHLEVVKLLVKFSANINIESEFGITPLFSSVYEGHKEIAKFLLENGADFKKIHRDGKTTALSFAKLKKHHEIVELLQEYIDKDNAKLELPNQEDCAICSDKYVDEPTKPVKVLNCGHKFHKECVNSWLAEAHNFCPYCKKQQ